MSVDITGWPVMPAMCSTCPFGPDGDPDTAQAVIKRNLLHSSQICHHRELQGQVSTHLCRGARDIQLKVLAAWNLIPEPTDEAFEAESKRRQHGR